MSLKCLIPCALIAALVGSGPGGNQARAAELAEIEAAMLEAATFFREELSVEGSYAWFYNALDLSERRGEGVITLSQGWTEPPGTPAVGLAYLAAYKATGQPYFLDAAKETATALIRTQLESGGWQGLMEFDPEARKAWCYQVDRGSGRPACAAIEDNRLKDASSLDDNQSQSPLTFLIYLDQELAGSMSSLTDAVTHGLSSLVEAQYPNGAWPFRLDFRVPDPVAPPEASARYPADWPRTFVQPEGEVYVVNDHLMRDVIRLFLLAHDTYGAPTYLQAAKRGGDFLLAAQMPEPQPGWAQTYNADLNPIWGRRFEPPSIASNETAGSIQALIELYAATGEERYLGAVQPAIRWLEQSRLSGDEWARFYELGSNQPLYVDTDYIVTYSDQDLPDHYRFRGSFGIERFLKRWNDTPRAIHTRASPAPKASWVNDAISTLDKHGRWPTKDVIRSGSFAKRMVALAAFVTNIKGEKLPDFLGSVRHQLDR
jgi:hypothetical protein